MIMQVGRISIALLIMPILMFSQPTKRVDELSARSLYLIMTKADTMVGTATGFVVQVDTKYYLITNWHVVTGRDAETDAILNPKGMIPDHIYIWHHGKVLGNWVPRSEPLYNSDSTPRWIEHPLKNSVDVIALPLSAIDLEVQIYLLDLSLANTDMVPIVAMPVSIIGFPLGLTSSGVFPIWKTGHIASDPDLDFNKQPAFLIDATTRGGMSGSPVVLRLWGGFQTRSGNPIMSQSGPSTLFLGVYSAQQQESEIGKVWRPSVITEIFKH